MFTHLNLPRYFKDRMSLAHRAGTITGMESTDCRHFENMGSMGRIVPNGTEIRSRREAAGLTQEGVADRAGINKRTVERIESGQRSTTTTIDKLARVLGVETKALVRASTQLLPLVWFMGSYSAQTREQRNTTSQLLPRLANGLIRLGIRLVCGESAMLVDLAREYRAALPRDSPFPCAVVLFGRLRGTDLKQLFMVTMGSVPVVAVLLGGSVQKGRVREEFECAGVAGIPVIAIPATGGAASTVTSTAKLDARLRAAISRVEPRLDRGDLADAIIEAVRQVTEPQSSAPPSS
jgi:transcriptional regulator with XRE-family HTH domain